MVVVLALRSPRPRAIFLHIGLTKQLEEASIVSVGTISEQVKVRTMYGKKDSVVKEELHSILPALSKVDNIEALALFDSLEDNGYWSDMQQIRAIDLIVKACTPVLEPQYPIKDMKGPYYKLVLFFQGARDNGLAWPKLSIHSLSGDVFKLALTGDKSKEPGSINITDGDKYPHNVWFGRITPDGVYTMPKTKGFSADTVVSLLSTLMLDMPATVKKDSEITTKCSFCNTKLTDHHSIKHGYGPICAKHWNLPW